MPIYAYQIIHDDGSEGEIVELQHGMSDPPLTEHPDTGETLVRIFSAPHLAGAHHERAVKQSMSDSNLERLGFTKYVKSGKGNYEKRTGQGPSTLSTG